MAIDKWPERIGHPTIEPLGARHGAQHVRRWIGVDVRREPGSEYGAESHECIAQADLFPIFLRPALISDRSLIDARVALCKFNNQLGIEPETFAAQRDALSE